jgi:hypothetical protein
LQLLRLEAQQKRKDRMQNALRDPKNDLSPTGSGSEIEPISIIDVNENGETLSASESMKKQIEENYYDEMLHFLPSLVDVSAIQSAIVSVACGNQHSIILTGSFFVLFFCNL